MFKLPTWAEIKALFFKDVASAVSSITTAVAHLQAISAHHDKQWAKKTGEADDLRYRATALNTEALAHSAEASKADAVALKLQALVS